MSIIDSILRTITCKLHPGRGSGNRRRQLALRVLKYGLVLCLPALTPAFASHPDCLAHLQTRHADHDARLDHELSDYQKLIEESLVYRSRSIDVANRLKRRIDQGLPLSGADLHILNEGLIAHLQLRKRLYHFAEMHECWIDLDPASEIKYRLNADTRLKGLMISLSAALTLYDNYLLAIAIFEEDDKLRRFLNSEDSGYNKHYDELATVTLSYNSVTNRSRVRRAIHHYEQAIKADRRAHDNKDFSYLQLLIEQSPSYQLTREYAPFRVLGNKLRFLDAVTSDTLSSIRVEGINMFSMVFGNTIGLIESRKGKLYNNQPVIDQVRRRLQAGDILLEKTPFRLTDKFIPGHWGHAAIWVGTESELKSLGIWDHPLVRPHQPAIRHGYSVIEALRAGVVMNTLEHFMNIDDLGVLRVHKSDPNRRAETLLMAFRQLGKDYDFNFDIETTEKIVCSELIYVTYTDIKWPTENTLGRYTISPDNIAIKSLNGGPLDLVMLIHDGQMIDKSANIQMARLLQNGQ